MENFTLIQNIYFQDDGKSRSNASHTGRLLGLCYLLTFSSLELLSLNIHWMETNNLDVPCNTRDDIDKYFKMPL